MQNVLLPRLLPRNLLPRIFKTVSRTMSTEERAAIEENFNVITEGKASILTPKGEKQDVFYNPIQQFNRDLSVTAIKAWDNLYFNKDTNKTPDLPDSNNEQSTGDSNAALENGEPVKKLKRAPRGIELLEGLSATGLRSIRFAKEIPSVKKVVANDLLSAAVASINQNIRYNEVEDNVRANEASCNMVMYTKKFDVIDLDPYGTVAPFIDAAVQSVRSGGLLLVTCTDLQVLAGNTYPEKCFALYGGVNLTNKDATHESALRLVLGLIKSTAAKYGRYVEPLLSLSIDYYVRVFVRVVNKPILVKNHMSEMMVGYSCSGCHAITTQAMGKKEERENSKGTMFIKYGLSKSPPIDENCKFCGSVHHMVGPMYGGPLHNAEFVNEILRINKEEHKDDIYKTRKRIEGMLTLAASELPDSPFYFSPNTISSILKLSVPSLSKVSAGLGSMGYTTSLTHAQPSCLKTDANWDVIWYVLKKFTELEKPDFDYKNCKSLTDKMIGYKIFANSTIGDSIPQELKDKLSFDKNETSGKIDKLRSLKIVRYQENPSKFWGPKAKPTGPPGNE